MITEIDFNVKGEERKKLAYAIGESLGMPVKYTRTPKFDYLIGSCILDKNGVFHASNDLSESELELVLERFYKGEPIQQSELPEDVAKCFQAIIEDREKPKVEKVVDGYTGFLFVDDKGLPLVAMHWEHRFNHMVKRYNDIYRVQMPDITPHVCRHTYCSNMAKSGMNPKTLQYLMGHSDIGVTLNTYTHLGLEDAEDELRRLEDLQNARKELERTQGEKPVSQKMFKAI